MKDSRILMENTRISTENTRTSMKDSRILTENTRTSSHGKGMFLCHTDSTDVTDIFCEHESHEKGEVASLLRNYKFSNRFSKDFERSDLKQ